MKKVRFFIAFVLIFAYIFCYEWIFHGHLLSGIYTATANLWRSPEEMQNYFYWIIAGQALLSFMFCFIFSNGYEDKGILEGARYGFYIALLLTAPQLIMYAVQPIPAILMVYWIIGGFVELIVGGALLAFIYKKFVCKGACK